jgi:uncharacterized protein YebE (UPF0316 family)
MHLELFGDLNPTLVTWVILPLLIFTARIIDVSLGTIRVIFISKGMRVLAPLLGFFEILIWLVAIGQILQNLTHWINYIAYASGFAMGNYVGMLIENKLALGSVLLRVIINDESDELAQALIERNYGVTNVDAVGRYGPVQVMFMLIARHDVTEVVDIIHKYSPKAFYSIEDVRYVNEGVFPERAGIKSSKLWYGNWLRKGK